MNVENILKVADAIEGHTIPDLGFNMGAIVEIGFADRFGTDCGTVACIAGWAYCLLNERRGSDGRATEGVLRPAAEWLELDEYDAQALFTNIDGDYERFTETTPSQAVAVLRHLAATGEVDWSAALAKHEASL